MLATKLFGRERELAEIRATLDGTAGHTPNLVLHGDPGVGKTVLLNAAISEAKARGHRVLGGMGYESEAKLAFAGMHQLLVPVIEYLDQIDDFHRSVLRRVLAYEDGPSPDRLAISSATLAVLIEIAKDSPLLIAVDDAQWVDHPTRELVMFLLLRLEGTNVRAIFTRRPLLSTERVTPGISMFEVQPLRPVAARELLLFLHPDLPPAARQRVLEDADGNPLAIAELPHAISTNAVVGLELLPATAPLRTRLEAGYASRVRTLEPEVRHALLLTALDGDRIERNRDAAGAPGMHLQSVHELERLGLVSRDSTLSGIRFRHPLVRSAIVNTASPTEIRAAHSELAGHYRFEPQRRVWHLAAATVEPEEAIAAEIESAANQISIRGGAGLAVGAMSRAAQLSPSPAQAARRLQLAAALATESGQFGLAEKLIQESSSLDESTARRIEADLTTIHLLIRRDGDLLAARQMMAHVVMQAEAAANSSFAEQVCELLTTIATLSDDATDWHDLAAFVSACTVPLSEPVHLTLELVGQAPRKGDLRQQVRLASVATPTNSAPWMLARLCRLGMRLDLNHEQRQLYMQLISRETGGGAVTAAISGYQFAGHVALLSGEWEDAELLANTGLELAIRHDVGSAVDYFRVTLGRLAACRGDSETVNVLSNATESWSGPRGIDLFVAGAAINRGLLALAERDYERAYLEFASRSPINRVELSSGFAASAVFDVVEAAARSGRLEQAQTHLAAAEAADIASLSPRTALLIAGARALLADDDDAVRLFEKVFTLPDADKWPFEQARVRLIFGEHLRRLHRPGDARPHLRRAADTFLRLGATIWADRAQQELRATGVAIESVGERAKNSELSDLTPQQVQVAHMAASGLSNKEIGEKLYLSPRTVSAHLYRIFPKLGITSRSALRDALVATAVDAETR
jgi:DNA-binding CsgD family transcriptional regulator